MFSFRVSSSGLINRLQQVLAPATLLNSASCYSPKGKVDNVYKLTAVGVLHMYIPFPQKKNEMKNVHSYQMVDWECGIKFYRGAQSAELTHSFLPQTSWFSITFMYTI